MGITSSDVIKPRKRLIVTIDREKCVGCGKCVEACLTEALKLVDGKAKLVDETLCDGFGSCIAACEYNSIRLEYREAKEFNWNIISNISFEDLMKKLSMTSKKIK